MTLSELKFAESDFEGQDIASLDDRPKISAAELKKRFDNIGKAMLALGRFNQLIDSLISGEALADIKVTVNDEEKSLQSLLTEYQQELTGLEELQNELDALAEDVAKLDGVPDALEELQSELDALAEDVAKLNEAPDAMDSLTVDMAEYRQQLGNVEQDVESLQRRLDTLSKWDEKEVITDLDIAAHFANEGMHITAEEREEWNGKMAADQRGVAGGVASLGEDGKIPEEQLPEISSVTIRRW